MEKETCDKCGGSGIKGYVGHISCDDYQVEAIRREKCDGFGHVELDSTPPLLTGNERMK